MDDLIRKIKAGNQIEEITNYVIDDIYKNGPVEGTNLEILACIKYYQPTLFKEYESDILSVMGLFFKDIQVNSFKSLIMQDYKSAINDIYNKNYTPVQMDMINNIIGYKNFSFSSSTSTGKSFVFRDIINKTKNSIVIIVPSRALINEYYVKILDIINKKNYNVLTFVDIINKHKRTKNIFILTPERARDLFKYKTNLIISTFIFDEAQLSNEDSSRGVIFDSLVRRIDNNFPNSRKLFAFPYISNPEAELTKNKIKGSSFYRYYKEKNVGQMFLSFFNNEFYNFGIDKSVMGNTKEKIDIDPVEKIIKEQGTVLIYTSKSKIYNGKILEQFSKYCDYCQEITDEDALKLIAKFKKYMGSSDNLKNSSYSPMLKLLKRGIVLHHGSLPLQIRLIIEEMTRLGYCKICFSTSTLVQGINMPFDAVWLDKFEKSKELDMKNLIGRAGRSTQKSSFDFGIVIVKDENKSDFRKIIQNSFSISAESLLDTNKELPEDLKEYRDAIKNDDFADEYNLTNNDLKKLKSVDIQVLAKEILDLLFMDETIISGENFSNLDKNDRQKVYEKFQEIYSFYLGGRDLSKGEKSILSTAIRILLWQIQGKTFKQIVGYRYAFIRKNNEVRKILNQIKKETDTKNTNLLLSDLEKIEANFTMKCSNVPDKNLPSIPLFEKGTLAYNINFDVVAFDTYDYIDKIISFKLKDIFYAIFFEIYLSENDMRALKFSEYLKYGTADSKEILLLRYGFSFETIEWLKPYVENISEDEIVFKKTNELSDDQLKEIQIYLDD